MRGFKYWKKKTKTFPHFVPIGLCARFLTFPGTPSLYLGIHGVPVSHHGYRGKLTKCSRFRVRRRQLGPRVQKAL